MKFAQELGEIMLKEDDLYTGGEVFRNGRQTAFDLISNLRKVFDEDGR
jgi:hypothetical protein